jgi:glycosyltransferase involved in cell wall biosynthesis
LTWADQLIVIDSFSTDNTVELARKFTPHVYQHEYVNSATQKNRAMANLPIEGDWTLIVDADERVVPELAEEIRGVLEHGDPEVVGYFINRRNIFFGRWIRHAGLYPSWNLRLFRTGSARYETKEVDADVTLLVRGQVGYLRSDMVHYSFITIDDCVRKWNRYSTWDATERCKPPDQRDDSAIHVGAGRWYRTALRRFYERLPGKPLIVFAYLYVFKAGFLDGKAGYYTCGLFAWREFLTNAKVWQTHQGQMLRANTND